MTTRRRLLGGLAALAGASIVPLCVGSSSSPRKPVRSKTPAFHWGVGIESTWMVQADPRKDGSRRPLDELLLTQHYEQWESDLKLAADLGVTTIRYAVPWHRVERSPGEYDWSWIDRPIELMVRQLGILPILDLIHYGTPPWIPDGIGDERFPDALARHAGRVARHYDGMVSHFTPCNEPSASASFCGALGTWPPYKTSIADWASLGVRIARAIVLATRSLRSAQPGAVIVSADSIGWPLAEMLFPTAGKTGPEFDELRVATGSFPSSLAYGKLGADHRLTKLLVDNGVASHDLEWFRANAAPPDIVGYDHYPDLFDFPDGPDYTRGGKEPLQQAALEATEKVEAALRRTQAYFGLPIYLTETSAGLAASSRAAYATALLDMVNRLRRDAFPIVGVNWWPLLEAFAWTYREDAGRPPEAFLVPGGWNNALYDLKLERDGTLRRIETEAVAAFKAVIRKDRRR